MEFRDAHASDIAAMAELAAPLQARCDRHVAYLGCDADGIAGEVTGLTWEMCSCVAVEGERLVAWLVGDVDEEMGRVWWNGPFVDRSVDASVDDHDAIADELLSRCRARLDATVDEEELAFDDLADQLARWAERQGFVGEQGSWVLTLPEESVDLIGEPVATVRPATADDADAVARLHDDVFPGTHSTGAGIVGSLDHRHPRLVTEVGGAVAGYIAVEQQEDGAGYIDFIGVDPPHRRLGLGRDLVRAGVAALAAIDARPVHLTVREESDGARALYASLGFREERLVRPFRRGFALR